MTDDTPHRTSTPRPSTPGLLAAAIRQATDLVGAEFALVRLEASETLTRVLASVFSLFAASVLILVALIFLLQGLAQFLVAKGVAPFAASLIMGGGIAVVALLAVVVAVRNLGLARLKPVRSLRQVEIARRLAKGKAP